MAGAACRVCGGSDLNLVDGYYYCIECGTQDANVRETVIEYTAREDGTYAHTTKKRITIFDTKEEMSPEWYKWHTFNFILSGLADELVLLGAKPSFKVKLLWIWSKYIKRLRKDDELDALDKTASRTPAEPTSFRYQEEPELLKDDDQMDLSRDVSKKFPINIITMKLLQAMIYVALNIDESDIQLSDLFRFIKEDRISCKNCLNLVPKDLKYKKMDFWMNFSFSKHLLSCVRNIRGFSMSLFKALNLGTPVVPNMHKLVDRYVKELCLPGDFRNFVFSLINYIPVDLEMHFTDKVVRIPDYEGVAMAYIVVALKMCFGLDGCYENILSNAVIPINSAKTHDKAYKHNMFAITDRLFSFRDWSIYMEYRKRILAKYYFPVALKSKTDIDPQVFISHTMQRVKIDAAVNISDEVMMEILDRMVPSVASFKAPKIVFPPSVTPLSTYTDVLLNELNDFEIKELLSEDFTQYSLKYITENLELIVNDENIISGVSVNDLLVNEELIVNSHHERKEKMIINKSIVFVRHCDNDNWLITKPPTSEHVKLSDNNSDLDYVSNVDNSSVSELDNNEKDALINNERCNEKQVDKDSFITDDNVHEGEVADIFKDDFCNVTTEQLWSNSIKEQNDENDEFNNTETALAINYGLGDENITNDLEFDKETFDREEVMERLIDLACKQYNIITSAKRTPLKRGNLIDREATINDDPKPKKHRAVSKNKAQPGQAKLEVENICASYFAAMLKKSKEDNSVNSVNYMDNLNESITSGIENDGTANTGSNKNLNNNDDMLNITTEKESNVPNEATELEKGINLVENNEIDEAKSEHSDHFDEKKYDSSQLYLKVNKKNDTRNEDDESVMDLEIANILSRPVDVDERIVKDLDQSKNHDKSNQTQMLNVLSNPLETVNNEVNSDNDETPLNVVFQNMPCSQNNIGSSQLVYKEKFDSYYYWCRHELGFYNSPSIFESVLSKNYPKSFVWVLRLCASLIENHTSELYEHVACLEKSLKHEMKKRNGKRGREK